LLSTAVDVSLAAPGYRFAESDSDALSGAVLTVTTDGSFSRSPRSAEETMTMQAPSFRAVFNMVIGDGAFYMKVPALERALVSGDEPWWQVSAKALASIALIPELGVVSVAAELAQEPQFVLGFVRAAQPVAKVATTAGDGVPATEYVAELSARRLLGTLPLTLRSVVRNVLSGQPIEMHVWVGAGDLVRRVEYTWSAAQPGAAATVTSTIDVRFLSYGRQPTPTLTSKSETVSAATLLAAL
jgi:hypothetical protein